MTSPHRIDWNDPVIIKAFGGNPDGVQKLCERNGLAPPSDWAVYQWCSRKRISGSWRASIVYALLREQKIDVSVLFKQRARA